MASPKVAAEARTVVVIGAGVVGVCTALSLQREGFKVTLISNFAGGMPRQREIQVVFVNSPAIIANTNEFHTPSLNIDLYSGRTCVQ